VAEARREWRKRQPWLDTTKLVFIDETWAKTNMARARGRCRRGQRLLAKAPYGRWRTTTFVGALRVSGLTAPFVLDRPINGQWFRAYVEEALAPTLEPGNIVVMDNLGSHKSPRVRAMIEARGASLVYLPSYSPDLNPIEMAFSKLKALLRKAARRNTDDLWSEIAAIIATITPQECKNYFKADGYVAA
jgi:transposase